MFPSLRKTINPDSQGHNLCAKSSKELGHSGLRSGSCTKLLEPNMILAMVACDKNALSIWKFQVYVPIEKASRYFESIPRDWKWLL